jgi:peptidoglycan/xylan/chitin deacetylase (PgdA/CDA1 family)
MIGQTGPLPFDAWSLRNRYRAPPEAWRSMNMEELETCLASGLVSIGAHSHRHLKANQCTPAQLIEEVEQARAVLVERLGEAQAQAYSYPYGLRRHGFVPPEYVQIVKAAGYRLAVATDLGLASPETDRYFFPRVEAHAVDGPCVIRAKAWGALAPYGITDRLRRANRAV